MRQAVLWAFLALDVAGVVWCVSALHRELRRRLDARRTDRQEPVLPLLQLPDDFVLVPAWLPEQRSAPLRLVS